LTLIRPSKQASTFWGNSYLRSNYFFTYGSSVKQILSRLIYLKKQIEGLILG